MAERIPQSTAFRVPLRAYLSTDHLSAATGKTIAVTISKNGGAFGNPSAGATNATEIANGWYYVDLSTTDTGTAGPLIVYGTASGVDTVELVYTVNDPTVVSSGVNVVKWLNSTPNALQSGRVDSYIGAVASGVIAAASFASGALDAVWSTTTRTLSTGAITASTFAANALDAVWSTTTRTLSAFSFNVTVGDIVAAALGKFFTVNSGSTYGTSVNGSVVKEIASNAATSTATIASAVLDAVAANYNTSGSIGNKINSAGSATDPLTNTVPGSYAVGTAGYNLGRINDNGVTVTYVNPVLTNQNISIVRGDDYKNADNRALTFTLSGFPSITGATITLSVNYGGTNPFTATGTVTSSTTCYVELTSANTTTFSPGPYPYDLQATLTNGDIVTLARGTFAVAADVR